MRDRTQKIRGGVVFILASVFLVACGPEQGAPVSLASHSAAIQTHKDNIASEGTASEGGLFFGSRHNLSNNAGGSHNPSIAISGAAAFVVWEEGTAGRPEILFSRSTDRGITFSSSIALSSSGRTPSDPLITLSGSGIQVTWHDTGSGYAVWSFDEGAHFTSPVLVPFTPAPDTAIARLGTTAFSAWEESRSGNTDIFLSRSVDGGVSFYPATNLSNNTGESYDPAIAVSEGLLFIVWEDTTPGNSDIFLARFER
jgi:hypothetical protein